MPPCASPLSPKSRLSSTDVSCKIRRTHSRSKSGHDNSPKGSVCSLVLTGGGGCSPEGAETRYGGIFDCVIQVRELLRFSGSPRSFRKRQTFPRGGGATRRPEPLCSRSTAAGKSPHPVALRCLALLATLGRPATPSASASACWSSKNGIANSRSGVRSSPRTP